MDASQERGDETSFLILILYICLLDIEEQHAAGGQQLVEAVSGWQTVTQRRGFLMG